SPLKAVWTALSDPAAVWHMGMPIAVRLRRLAAQFAVGAGEVKGAGS
ncbi:MAG: glycosyl transferase, partial [Mesorhizobium sp.]